MLPLIKFLLKEGEKVHIGFLSSWDSVKDITFSSLDAAIKKIKSDEINITVCGHSLGAAVSTLSAYAIKYKYPDADIKCCNIGSPRVGNKKFKENYKFPFRVGLLKMPSLKWGQYLSEHKTFVASRLLVLH